MGDVEFTIEDGEIRGFLSSVERKSKDLTIPLHKAAELVSRQIAKKFITSDNGQWDGIAKATQRKRQNKVASPLINTGDLLLAAIATEPGVPNSLYSMAADGFTLGVERKDVYSHLFGNPRTGEPSRDWLPNDEELEIDALQTAILIEDYLLE